MTIGDSKYGLYVSIAGSSSGFAAPPPSFIQPNGGCFPAANTISLRSPCEQTFHVMEAEAEYADGSITGKCVNCGETITGRRLVGGLGVAMLRMAMLELLSHDGEPAGLAQEIVRIQEVLDLEEQALNEARALLETAREMLVKRLDS
jgi:hypothetical protein